ncbi:hypothetical protein L950_0204410 [Sphingobacterium sp. IITKGP-BTPF85]|nr:hypothetical protein L950_0204410 [Sphingobacterium sp. IITKGP-BTPF85]
MEFSITAATLNRMLPKRIAPVFHHWKPYFQATNIQLFWSRIAKFVLANISAQSLIMDKARDKHIRYNPTTLHKIKSWHAHLS